MRGRHVQRTITFRGYVYDLVISIYSQPPRNPRIQLWDIYDGFPMYTASLNPTLKLPPELILIQNSGPTSGILPLLVSAGVLIATGRKMYVSSIQAHVCRLLSAQ
jgi:hypothetical protein